MQVIPPYKDKTLFKARPLKFQCKSRHAVSQSWWWNITEKSTFARELIRISRDVRTGDNLLWWLSPSVQEGKDYFLSHKLIPSYQSLLEALWKCFSTSERERFTQTNRKCVSVLTLLRKYRFNIKTSLPISYLPISLC